MIAKVGIYISQLIPKSHFLYHVAVSLSLFLDAAQTPRFPQFLTNTVLSLSTFLLLSSIRLNARVCLAGESWPISFSLFLSLALVSAVVDASLVPSVACLVSLSFTPMLLL